MAPSAASRWKWSQNWTRRAGSTPTVGSSRKMTAGWWASAQAIDRRRRIPPERSWAGVPVRLSSSTSSSESHQRGPVGLAVERGEERQVLPDRQLGVDAVGLGHVADAGQVRARRHLHAQDAGLAARRRREPGQQADQRRLARAVRAEQAVDPAGRQRHVDRRRRRGSARSPCAGRPPRPPAAGGSVADVGRGHLATSWAAVGLRGAVQEQVHVGLDVVDCRMDADPGQLVEDGRPENDQQEDRPEEALDQQGRIDRAQRPLLGLEREPGASMYVASRGPTACSRPPAPAVEPVAARPTGRPRWPASRRRRRTRCPGSRSCS